MIIKFRLIKFEKAILFQLISHSFDMDWINSIHTDFKIKIDSIYQERTAGISIYFKKPGVSDSYISLECEKSSGRKVEIQNFNTNEQRDKYYTIYLKALEDFVLRKDNFKLTQI